MWDCEVLSTHDLRSGSMGLASLPLIVPVSPSTFQLMFEGLYLREPGCAIPLTELRHVSRITPRTPH